jgi:hypothetical protein
MPTNITDDEHPETTTDEQISNTPTADEETAAPAAGDSVPLPLTPLLQKDFSKLHNFFIQAVCGPYMAIYRSTGKLPATPRDVNLLKYYLAKYLNDTHLEVVTGQDNDEYIRTIFEDCMTHHSINCIVNIVFHLGCEMIDRLVQVQIEMPPLETSDDGKPQIPPERIDALRNLISGIVESWTPNFAELFDHTCSGQSIAELKAEIQSGTYVPPFTFSGA